MNAPLSPNVLAAAAPDFTATPHEDHPRLTHIGLQADAVRAFLDAARGVDVQNLEYIPYMRFHLAGLFEAHLGSSLVELLRTVVKDRERGGFTLGLEGVSQDHDAYVRFSTAVGHLLGSSNHDAMSGKYYARFLVKHTDASDSYLRQAYRLFTMHTDGTFVTEATDWLLMMKFEEKNAVGGESRFLHIDDWKERETFLNSPYGTHPFVYKAPGSKNVEERVARPVFFQSRFGLSISFIDQFVQPTDRGEAAYLRDLSDSMESSDGTREVRLPVGDLVVLNNYFYLHGRAPFEQNPDLYRELLRQRGVFSE